MSRRGPVTAAAALVWLAALSSVAARPARAHDCSGLSDCFAGNIRPALWLLLGLLLVLGIGLLLPVVGKVLLGSAARSLLGAAARSRVAATVARALAYLFRRPRPRRPPPRRPPPRRPPAGRPPRISRQKQDGHVRDTPQWRNRQKAGKPTSTFNGGRREADRLVREAWEKGTPVRGRPNVRDYDFGRPIGTGPRGGSQTRVRVHQNRKGDIHGHPSGPETPLP